MWISFYATMFNLFWLSLLYTLQDNLADISSTRVFVFSLLSLGKEQREMIKDEEMKESAVLSVHESLWSCCRGFTMIVTEYSFALKSSSDCNVTALLLHKINFGFEFVLINEFYSKASFRLACAWCMRFPFVSNKWLLQPFLMHATEVKIKKLMQARTKRTPVWTYLKSLICVFFYIWKLSLHFICPLFYMFQFK